MTKLVTPAPAKYPYEDLPDPLHVEEGLRGLHASAQGRIPNERECVRLWDKYGMLPNIRAHSRQVAHICASLATRATELGFAVSVEECRCAGLLHDLAKTRCLETGGSHAQLGAAWVLLETGNYVLAQATLLHVHWFWPLPEGKAICRLPFFLEYADKRVRHDVIVTLAERFDDLRKRYGFTEAARTGITATQAQAVELEARLSSQLHWKLDEYTFD